MPRPDDKSDLGEIAANVPQSDGARDDSTAAWFAFCDQWTPMLRGYFRRLPCTRAERDELVMDVLVDGFVGGSELTHQRATEDTIRALARRASAHFQRSVRHELHLEHPEDVPADTVRGETVAEQERLWMWLEHLLKRLPDGQRLAIERHADGIPDALIAQEAKCATVSVAVLRARGMRELRRLAASSLPPDINDATL